MTRVSIFAVPMVADTLGRTISLVTDHAPKPKLRSEFAALPVKTEALRAPTRHGDVRCAAYLPANAETSPVYVNLHGGGFVIGYPEQDDPWCRYLATHAGTVVVNVDYATSPRRRFPVALEQAYDVVNWAASPERRWDGSRLCVGGQSAGGNLAAGVARMALEGAGPRIALQILNYPVLDLVTSPRAKATSGGRVPPPWLGEVFNHSYVPNAAQREHRLVSPAWGDNDSDLLGIAPAVVVTCERDSLRTEGCRYARRLQDGAALVEHFDIDGVDHGYDVRVESPDVIRQMWARIARRITEAGTS